MRSRISWNIQNDYVDAIYMCVFEMFIIECQFVVFHVNVRIGGVRCK